MRVFGRVLAKELEGARAIEPAEHARKLSPAHDVVRLTRGLEAADLVEGGVVQEEDRIARLGGHAIDHGPNEFLTLLIEPKDRRGAHAAILPQRGYGKSAVGFVATNTI